MNIKHIFFDLDHTLWDFDKNSKLTFKQIIEEQGVKLKVDEFLNIYLPINLKYWKLYRDEKVSKSTLRYGRLKETFDALNYKISDDLISIISEDYIKYLPNYNHLFEGTVEVLEYLKQKYELHIITNGFEEVQNLKMQKAGIDTYFKEVITSESVGVKKPNPKVFEFALMKAETIAKEAIMIGDSYEADILGALNCGMLAIHFTNETTPKKGVVNIKSLLQLKQYL
ncbi:noncanonical pyrimidine nucleotidase, YjjG family [Tenacibaculum sp. AHE15PA]|uniref:YjjG family noncanonical pyrimidine nucleotidase n=1 Tax=unclassified Tenacibaculum TaxID=2635139 RepID=UPI001C4F5638|nr:MULTISPECIES: YjjG family noncanonical pyrimidine nucleotidase [unclassified Tenacibaculum]QXP72495.1 noncanonical pyrimidine nucleotidase, YjjG family [Tenacibaculum sp. AHE14PA]QXP76411.1 noncanonical pyrimidine nucleotidase, YjjG family [Tenacibaculum sp. AHE15PA]